MRYGLELSHQAKKTLKLLDKAIVRRIEKRFNEYDYCFNSETPIISLRAIGGRFYSLPLDGGGLGRGWHLYPSSPSP